MVPAEPEEAASEQPTAVWTPRSSAILRPFGLTGSTPVTDPAQAPSQCRLLDRHFLVFLLVVFGFHGFVQGFPSLAYSYLEKDELKLSPSMATTLGSIIALPWSIKPIYGAISDMCAIYGMHRVPYIMLSFLVAGGCLIYCAMVPHLTVTAYCTIRALVEVRDTLSP